MKSKRRILIWTISVTLAIAIMIGVCSIYVSDYYRADNTAITSFTASHSVSPDENPNGIITFEPIDPIAGFIFYPGGKVEYTAYVPLMSALAEKGVLCILIPMPFNLAVLDMNAAKGMTDQYPEIDDWYIGGHSLGGSMAASFVADNSDDFEGLILLGSYSTTQIALPVLSIYGSEDKVMNREKYDKYKSNIDSSLTETVIDGGCHAYFGMYGAQDGDGMPSISNEEQINITVTEIIKFIGKE
ncbi:MAG: alpha/beta hydrolase [Clostridia bacterium]|nr:alpha/beta hydrolase [Clostridia bacterium]